MVAAERAAKSRRRAAGVVAARDRFYEGDVAREMVAFLPEAPRAVRPFGLRRLLCAHRRAGKDDLSRLHCLQARIEQPGADAAADAQHPWRTSICARWGTPAPTTSTRWSRRRSSRMPTATATTPIRRLVKRTEGLLWKAYAKERAALIDPKRASMSFVAGDPTKYNSQVKSGPTGRPTSRTFTDGNGTVRARANGVVRRIPPAS